MLARLGFAIALVGAATTAAAEPSVVLEGDVGFSDGDLDRAMALRGAGVEIDARVFRASDDVLVIEVGEHRRTLDMLGRRGPAAARVVAINLIDLAARRRTRPVPLIYGAANSAPEVPLFLGADREAPPLPRQRSRQIFDFGLSVGVGLDDARFGTRLDTAIWLGGPAYVSMSMGVEYGEGDHRDLPMRLGFGTRTKRLGLDTGAVVIINAPMCTRAGLESNVWWWLFGVDTLSVGPEVGTRVTNGCNGASIVTEGWLGLRVGYGRGGR